MKAISPKEVTQVRGHSKLNIFYSLTSTFSQTITANCCLKLKRLYKLVTTICCYVEGKAVLDRFLTTVQRKLFCVKQLYDILVKL